MSGRSPSLDAHPRVDDWIRLDGEGELHVTTGKVEIGQGLRTALARIAAEELDVELTRVQVHSADTSRGPQEGVTAGSLSLEHSGVAVQNAAAEARRLLLEAAAERLAVHVDQLTTEAGNVHAPDGSQVPYTELVSDTLFQVEIGSEVILKSPSEYRILGRSGPRLDLPQKVRSGAFVHDLRLPDMVFARVLRPPGLGWELAALSLERCEALPGVLEVVRDGSFVAVIAEREDQAERAREVLWDDLEWRPSADTPELPEDLGEWMVRAPAFEHPVIDGSPVDRAPVPWSPSPGAARTLSARFTRPYLMHGAIGPAAAVAHEKDGVLEVFTHSQSISITRLAIAQALDRAPESVRVVHSDGAGCYGHNAADDAALDAAFLAQRVSGRPLMVQWTREDEHRWEPYGPAMAVEIAASLDDDGRILAWSHEVSSFNQLSRPFPPRGAALLSMSWLREARESRPEPVALDRPEIGEYRNATPYYEVPEPRIVRRALRAQPLRSSSIRGLGAFANVFAIESFMDELAHAAGIDPLRFRLDHLSDPRAREVLEAVAERCDWSEGRPLGLAFARYENCRCYVALVVEVEVDDREGIRLSRAWLAADAGQVVDPDGLVNQLEGGFVQAASWSLLEKVRLEKGRLDRADWEGYPIMRFRDVPEIDTLLLNRPGLPFLGAGEASQGPTPAAISNAVFRSTGRRLRDTPFTPERLRATPPRTSV